MAGEPDPVESRVEVYLHPVEDGEITEEVHGWSLAPTYSLKQLRKIERRRTMNKLDSRQLRAAAKTARSRNNFGGILMDLYPVPSCSCNK